ncbi:MAG TPA: hypothetical protein VH206_13575 [Xanthobacteraceae bacterium]|jgi:hypothetical protein|nr:hypothetical protein [Xanthobacteraceae bacterium]
MDSGTHSGLNNLAQLGLRVGVDMRPTLLRVLTDLYVQKLTHTPDEERHYTELAMRLLDTVDVATRTAIAGRLAKHLAPPRRVIERLAADVPAVAEPVRTHPILRRTIKLETPKASAPAVAPVIETAKAQPLPAADFAMSQELHREQRQESPQEIHKATPPCADLNAPISNAVANELNELFFAANAEERRLILLNLEVATPLPAGRISLQHDSMISQRLERAALGRNREEFATELAEALQIPKVQAMRIADDKLGEPILTVAKALRMPRDLVYRMLLFVNTAVGHSVERVHALANLYDDMTVQTADHMVAIWQAMQKVERQEVSTTDREQERKPARYQPLLWNDEGRVRARTTSVTTRRAPAPQRSNDRRDVS